MSEWAPQPSFTSRFWVGCGVTLLAFSCLVVVCLQAIDAHALNRSGILVQATVTDTQLVDRSFSSKPPLRNLTYTYNYVGQSFTNTRNVREDFFDTHPTGTQFEVRILPDNPKTHEHFLGEAARTAWMFLALTAVLMIAGAAFTLSGGNLAALKARFIKKP